MQYGGVIMIRTVILQQKEERDTLLQREYVERLSQQS